jgi:hypothetical protein
MGNAVMTKKSVRIIAIAAVAALGSVSVPSLAQAQPEALQGQQSVGERLRSILGTILGNRGNNNSTLEAQWAAGRRPLADQRFEFESRVDAEVRQRTLSFADGDRIKADYRALVDLEARYGSDGQIDTNERRDLSQRYTALTEALQRGSYGGGNNQYPGGGYGNTGNTATVAQGETEFRVRVDAQLNARRISRTEASRLRSDYTALIRLEEQYLRDGYLDDRERSDIDERLDALDARLGDTGYTGGGYGYASPRQRLDAIAAAVGRASLSSSAQAQVRIELGDLMRLDSAYARLTPTADERAYLESRIANLESRVRIRR